MFHRQTLRNAFADSESSHEEGSVRHRLETIISSKFVETLIILLIFVDIGLLLFEFSIEQNWLCINGKVVEKPAGLTGVEAYSFQHFSSSQHILAPDLYQSDLSAMQPISFLKPLVHEQEQHQQHSHEHGQEQHSHEHGHEQHSQEHDHTNKVLMCETRHGPRAHLITHRCHIASIVILLVFLLELLMKYFVDPEKFCANKFLVFDLVIVTISLICETVITWMIEHYKPNQSNNLSLLVAALLLVRLWRIVRIIHGVFEYMHHRSEEEKKRHSQTDQLSGRIRHHASQVVGLNQLCEKNRINVPEHLRLHHSVTS